MKNALYWCLKNDVNIINISVGSVEFNDFYYFIDIINMLYLNGCIIVSAWSNNNKCTFPAVFSNVISISNFNYSSKQCYDIPDFYCFQKYYELDNLKIELYNSFCAPLLIVIIIEYYTLFRNNNIIEIKKYVIRNCENIIANNRKFIRPDFLYKPIFISDFEFFDDKSTIIHINDLQSLEINNLENIVCWFKNGNYDEVLNSFIKLYHTNIAGLIYIGTLSDFLKNALKENNIKYFHKSDYDYFNEIKNDLELADLPVVCITINSSSEFHICKEIKYKLIDKGIRVYAISNLLEAIAYDCDFCENNEVFLNMISYYSSFLDCELVLFIEGNSLLTYNNTNDLTISLDKDYTSDYYVSMILDFYT